MKNIILVFLIVTMAINAQNNEIRLTGNLNQDFYLSSQNIYLEETDSLNIQMKTKSHS